MRASDNILRNYMASNAAKQASSSMTVQSFEKINKETARVIMSFTGDFTEGRVEKAVASAFDNKLRLLPDSAIRPNEDEGNAMRIVTAFVAINPEVKPYSDDAVKGMSAVTANVFKDDGDNVWEVAGEGDDRFLVAVSDDDITELLSSRQSQSIVTASMNVPNAIAYQGGEAVAWYDLKKEEYRFGLAIDTARVVEFNPKAKRTDDLSVVSVPASLVIAKVDDLDPIVASRSLIDTTARRMQKEVAGAGSKVLPDNPEPITPGNMLQRHMSYMLALYMDSPGYIEKLRGLLTNFVNRNRAQTV